MATLSISYPPPLERHAIMGLSPDEIRFLQACDPYWFDRDPEEISTILSAAYKLLSELVPEYGADRRADASA
jgi:hypothetical protein